MIKITQKYYCDRCGCKIKWDSSRIRLSDVIRWENKELRFKHLCEGCSDSIVEFLEEWSSGMNV